MMRAQTARRAELGDLLQQIGVRVEEERDARREVVDRQAARARRLDVGDAVGQRERDLLHGVAARLANMIAADADGVPARHLVATEREAIRVRASTAGRIDVRPARHVLLEDVVLDRPDSARRAMPRSSATATYRHSRVAAVALMVIDVDTRSSGNRRAARACRRGSRRRPRASDLAARERMVRVAPHLRRQVEGDRQAGLPDASRNL